MDDSSVRRYPGSVPAVLELDPVFEALAHPRRRYLLYTLLEDTEWSLREIAAKVAAWEDGPPSRTVTDDEVERVYVSLYHNHVPKLADDGIVEFAEAEETIRRGDNADQVLAVLENAGGSRDSEQEAHARMDYNDGVT